jgi:glucose-6-phosphate-specific signal transduction histidine kinase
MRGIIVGHKARHFGLQGMRERAQRIGGVLDFRTEHRTGIEVELVLPAAAAYQDERANSLYAMLKRLIYRRPH